MSKHYHVLVWIDHREAKVFKFNAIDVDHSIVRSTHPDQHIHHKANSGDSGHAAVDHDFLERVAVAILSAGAVLITGPANAKTELVSHINKRHPDLAGRISSVQTLDHPSDGSLLAFGRSFFKVDDLMHNQFHR